MIKIKRFGFTLAEVLIAMLIVGIITILILPSLSKTIKTKSRMSLLQNTVANVSDVVQREINQTKVGDITLTNIYKDPEKFLEEFDIASSGEPFASSYKTISGTKGKASTLFIPSNKIKGQAAVRLKNGVGLGIMSNIPTPPPEGDQAKQRTPNDLYFYGANNNRSIIVDVNGAEKPNIIGVDYFVFTVLMEDNFTGARAGDTGAYLGGGIRPPRHVGEKDEDYGQNYIEVSKDEMTTSCKEGNGAACFRLVELSGYKPDYLK